MSHQITLFPQELRDLQWELMHPAHSDFNRKLSQRPRPFDEVLQDICTALGIVVDGTYGPEDQLALAKRCQEKLVIQRNAAVANITLTKH